MRTEIPTLRFFLLGMVALASLAMAWANGLGYVWSGAWNRPALVAVSSAYLPLYFAAAWLLVPATRRAWVAALWTGSVLALATCIYGAMKQDAYPLKITLMDFVVLTAIPIAAIFYRWIAAAPRQPG